MRDIAQDHAEVLHVHAASALPPPRVSWQSKLKQERAAKAAAEAEQLVRDQEKVRPVPFPVEHWYIFYILRRGIGTHGGGDGGDEERRRAVFYWGCCSYRCVLLHICICSATTIHKHSPSRLPPPPSPPFFCAFQSFSFPRPVIYAVH